jgi:hypothetical protein
MTLWRKSSHSGGSGATDCVEMAALDGARVGIRDSKHPEGGHLTLPRTELAGLVRRVKDGALDLPA